MYEILERHDCYDPDGNAMEARYSVLAPMHDTLDVPALTLSQAIELVDWLNDLAGY
jgi:hypothetical protein